MTHTVNPDDDRNPDDNQDEYCSSNDVPAYLTPANGGDEDDWSDHGWSTGDEDNDYVLLPQDPNQPSTLQRYSVQIQWNDEEDEDREEGTQAEQSSDERQASAVSTNSAQSAFRETVNPDASSSGPSTSDSTSRALDIPMDDEKINAIKLAMQGFRLPSSQHPPWATEVQEATWKACLMNKIKTRSNTEPQDTSDESAWVIKNSTDPAPDR